MCAAFLPCSLPYGRPGLREVVRAWSKDTCRASRRVSPRPVYTVPQLAPSNCRRRIHARSPRDAYLRRGSPPPEIAREENSPRRVAPSDRATRTLSQCRRDIGRESECAMYNCSIDPTLLTWYFLKRSTRVGCILHVVTPYLNFYSP